ncbi:MAG TPA: hypothetical protein VFO86_01515 [Terriglobia bacterium]|nr:hypothetical protein [Terriglobia bacterium]
MHNTGYNLDHRQFPRSFRGINHSSLGNILHTYGGVVGMEMSNEDVLRQIRHMRRLAGIQ